jgi:hypothetical protein
MFSDVASKQYFGSVPLIAGRASANGPAAEN